MFSLLKYRSDFEIYSKLSADEFADSLFKRVKPELEVAYMNDRWRHNNEYRFKGTFFRFVWNGFNRFNGILGGNLKVEKNQGLITVHSEINFKEIFLFCLIFSIIPIFDFWGLLSHRILLMILIWMVYILNFVISFIRINRFYKQKVQETFMNKDNSEQKKLL
ncbi:MAG: hypothetical protein MJ211_05040 [Bacteroidales bacterium]|nr:hypothetical protein [Bacteroidales bacterium]